ncbi:unnamed protein product [Mytilus coruscus]|uniref:Reverse transcriptase domain-containing protein n=1 Tax=Mytilus coruscus TaxID=42192 RepID=A0A6J8ABU2_MYTCO|nr:unnamed protein product [Mytilus coruscus]
MEDIEKVRAWATAKKLDEHTADQLLINGFNSIESLSLLTLEDIQTFDIPLGQEKMLMRAVDKTFVKETQVSGASNMAPDDAEPQSDRRAGSSITGSGLDVHPHQRDGDDPYIWALMDQLKTNQFSATVLPETSQNGTQQGTVPGVSNIFSWQDPQLCLKSVPIVDSKHLDIIDFVCSNVFQSDINNESLISQANGGQLVFKSGPVKPKLESITLCQWSMANISIMYKLLETGALNSQNYLDYMSYSKRIYQLITCYDMVSVFFYDREYRCLQHQHKFRWCTDVPHLQTVFLRPRFQQPNYNNVNMSNSSKSWGKGTSKPTGYASYTNAGKEICRRVKSLRDLNLKVWQLELENDFDKSFLLNGIENGFDIISKFEIPSFVELKNHPSANPKNPLYDKAHAQILIEIENGNYLFAQSTPKIISPLGIIPKPDGGVRIIHDCSRPEGTSVNDLVGEFPKQKFQTIDDAAKLVASNYFLAKVDLKSAYRSVRISKQSQQVTGFKWVFPNGIEHTLYDCKLPFGAKLAPSIFHRLSQAVKRMMSRRGFTIVAYLDDFLIFEPTQARCLEALNTLVRLLCSLGFLIKSCKLNWASAVVHGGRVFLRRIINSFTCLRQDWHKIRVQGELLADITWWQDFIASFNGKSLILDKIPVTSVITDACRSGGGGFHDLDWFYVNWEQDFPGCSSFHINELEAFSVILAAKRWSSSWENKRVIVLCDNMATVACINKCTCRNKILMGFLRELFWLSASFNFHIKAVHVPGSSNVLADHISRLQESSSFEFFMRYCLPQPLFISQLYEHMSNAALSFLLFRHTGHQGSEGTR